MLKHQVTPGSNTPKQVSGSLSSTSLDSSVDDSLDNIMEEQEKTARVVWDRYTNSASELSMAKRRIKERKESGKEVNKSKEDNIAVIKKLGETESQDIDGDKSDLDKYHYQEMRKVPLVPKLASRTTTPLDLEKVERKVLGLCRRQLMVVVMVLVVGLILYSVLLTLTVRAAQCQDTLETIMQQRRDWQRKVMEGVSRRKREN